jgi:Phage minor structural protein GP20.
MNMERKFLKELGLEKEVIDQIMTENGKDIEKAKEVAGEPAKELETELENLRGQIKERDKQLETLKLSGEDVETLKGRIETLQEENKSRETELQAEMQQLKLDNAVSKALTTAKAKNEKAVKALLELDSLELDKDDSVKGLQEQIEKLAKADDSKFLFETETKQKQKMKGVEPGNPGVEIGDEKGDFSKMSYTEITKYLAENPEAKID